MASGAPVLGMAPHYGFSIIIRKVAPRSFDPGDSLFGQAYERGRFRPRLPMKPRWHRAPGEEDDFVPAWRTEGEALAVVDRLKAAGIGQIFTFQVYDIRPSAEAGGPGARHPYRGVDGWTVPPVVREVVSQWKPSTPDRW